MSSLLFHLYILLAILVLYNLYTLIAIFLLPVSSDFPTQTLGATPYEYLMFTQQWPKAVNKNSRLTKFTIHGLWPSNFSGKKLICTGTNFSKSKMPPELEEELNISWPDVERGRNWGFWEHEYNKHGTCSEDIFDQTKYFELANKMRKTLDIAQMLKKRKIVPVVAAIKKENQNKSPSIRCKERKGSAELLLVEVVVCYDHDGKEAIDCPDNRTCGSPNQSILYV
ncbi:hypothetical protein FF1_033280 [Malus domestica]